MSERATKEDPSVILKFRYPPARAEILQLIADAETDGNLSELLRSLADRKIEDRLGHKRAANAAGRANGAEALA